MYARTAAIVSVLLCFAGCTQKPTGDSGITLRRASTLSASAESMVTAGLSAPRVAARHTFANAPDRGDLVAYPAKAVVRHDGAYTWHRADLSEAHALRAIATGNMEITTPSGEALKFRYERHVEHPSGDLTWVGRLQGGQQSDEVILTFGEKAVFGSISQPGKPPLRLTMSDGASWLVETDPAKIAGIDNEATRPRRPDYLVPPKSASGWQAFADVQGVTTAAAPVMLSAAAAATTVVDVLLGYTPGFAAANNGAPVTRLNNMIETTNQAYINSGVDSRVRLVHAMQVDYPDATDNGTALEELTGFKAPSTSTTPAPAFNALRAARDQYGADLVSLVRKFNTPENSGCGIAWLIGGGQSGIDSRDEFFGYSVVSDGRDAGTDGKTYFCREETLAHEMGHNMGSQHDVATAKGTDGVLDAKEYGAYPYSFGYKTGAGAGNFYTVMAYGDSGQTSYRVFSNPRSMYCGGGACGLTDQADNSKSLIGTMPIVRSFRASVVFDVNARGDINADGKSDLLWYHPGTRELYYWLMNGRRVVDGQGGFVLAPGYLAKEVQDFNGDGSADILWSDGTNLRMFVGNGSGGFSDLLVARHPAGYQLVGAGDVNADGKADLLWLNPSNSEFSYWIMNGSAVQSIRDGFFMAQGYTARAVGDFNGDNRLDVIWSNGTNVRVFSGSPSGGFTDALLYSYPSGWEIVGAGDLDGDDKDDLLWFNPNSREFYYWLLDGAHIKLGRGGFFISPGYTARKVADFDGDGKADVLWSDGTNVRMFLNSGDGGFTDGLVYSYPIGWKLIGG